MKFDAGESTKSVSFIPTLEACVEFAAFWATTLRRPPRIPDPLSNHVAVTPEPIRTVDWVLWNAFQILDDEN
ncbi:hypothetical protein LBMAG46_17200 [Planctomycetia bacterium]|nr:hypothetical protein LBMAG46_17200 [Planctomycetia bacterium]